MVAMKRSLIGRNRGSILFQVVVLLVLLATIALMMNASGGIGLHLFDAEVAVDTGRYAAEAGLAHARFRLDRLHSCYGYDTIGLSDISFGEYRYSVSVSPSAGSPVRVAATATGGDGSSQSVALADLILPALQPCRLVLQPDETAGSDAMIKYGDPGTNFGTSRDLATDSQSIGQGPVRSLMQFDLAGALEEAEIIDARMSLYLYSNDGDDTTVEAHRVTGAWQENEQGNPYTGVSWNTTDGVVAWSTAGGDYDLTVAGSFETREDGWQSMDLSTLVRDWSDGAVPNNGLVLLSPLSPGNKRKTYRSSNATNSCQRPKLTVYYRCDCGEYAAAGCNAAYDAGHLQSGFSTQAMGATDVRGMTYLPECGVFNGVHAPAGGAWILADKDDRRLYMTTMAGQVLASMASPAGDDPLGICLISAGRWSDLLAVVEDDHTTVNLVAHNGTVQDSFSTLAFSRRPESIAFMDHTLTGTYDRHLVVSSSKDAANHNVDALYLVDQNGVSQKTIDLSAVLSRIRGVAHLEGSDTLLVLDDHDRIRRVDFDGNVISQYSAAALGATQTRTLAINPETCDHVVWDGSPSQVLSFNQ